MRVRFWCFRVSVIQGLICDDDIVVVTESDTLCLI